MGRLYLFYREGLGRVFSREKRDEMKETRDCPASYQESDYNATDEKIKEFYVHNEWYGFFDFASAWLRKMKERKGAVYAFKL